MASCSDRRWKGCLGKQVGHLRGKQQVYAFNSDTAYDTPSGFLFISAFFSVFASAGVDLSASCPEAYFKEGDPSHVGIERWRTLEEKNDHLSTMSNRI